MPAFANLGPTLALFRMLAGKSQAQVARECRCGKAQISKYEVGRELPKLATLDRILESLGISALDLFFGLAVVDDLATGKLRLGRGALPLPRLPGTDPRLAEVDRLFPLLFSDLVRLYLEDRERRLADLWELAKLGGTGGDRD